MEEKKRLWDELVASIPNVEQLGDHIAAVNSLFEDYGYKDKYEELRREYISRWEESTRLEPDGDPEKEADEAEDYGFEALDFNADTE